MEAKKTTVSFPANLLKALRTYMAQQEMGMHDQSKVVAEALREYLEKRGVPIEENNDLIKFNVEPITPS